MLLSTKKVFSVDKMLCHGGHERQLQANNKENKETQNTQ